MNKYNSPLSASAISAHLKKPAKLGQNILFFGELESTNSFCRENPQKEGSVVIAEKQSDGRGRMGRSFSSLKGGLYMSVVIKPNIKATNLLALTGMSAVAVCRAIKRVSNIEPQIKWTNDLLIDEKKVCGILTEMTFSSLSSVPESIIIGIGINVNNQKSCFDAELKNIATSLYDATGKETDIALLAAMIIQELDIMYSALENNDRASFLEHYRSACITIGKKVRLMWKDNEQIVRAINVDDDFGLIIEHSDGRLETVRTGEVSVRSL